MKEDSFPIGNQRSLVPEIASRTTGPATEPPVYKCKHGGEPKMATSRMVGNNSKFDLSQTGRS